MNKLKFRLAKWLLNSDGFEVVALKSKDGNLFIEGDTRAIRYMDINGYFWNKQPLRRKNESCSNI